MTAKEVADLDKERGKKFYDEEDHTENSGIPTNKEPWLNKTPVNKSGEENMDGTDILKSYLSKASVNEIEDGEDIKKEGPIYVDDLNLSDPGLEDGEDIKKIAIPQGMAKADDCGILDMREHAEEIKKTGKPPWLDDEESTEDVDKALSTRSMHVPRPNAPYDRFDIMRSATTPTTRAHSQLRGPSGVAPLVGETLRDAEDDANVRSKQTMYKSCNFHGLTHRQDTGCVMCGDATRKSISCESCGDDMEKVKGGVTACKACG
jgi:hypothetical protein